MSEFKRFIECMVPGSRCNMRCEYCYIAQLGNNKTQEMATFSYQPEVIGKALRQERIGGCAYINICGVGETLLPKELPAIIYHILLQGHYVNVYTNGTISKRFYEICEFPTDLLRRLSFSFSFHYLELKKLKLLDTFFDNFNRVKEKGCTVVCNMVLGDCYLPYIDEIKRLTKEKLGAYPQISFPKKAHRNGNYTSLCNDLNKSLEIGNTFTSPYLDFTEKYYNYDKRYFCYAGAWSFWLNLATGNISKCYGHATRQNIFKNVNTPIKYAAVGKHCLSPACGGGLFLPMGVVPALQTPCYPDLKDRPEAGWYSDNYKEFLSHQLWETNEQYTKTKCFWINIFSLLDNLYYKLKYLPTKSVNILLKKMKHGIQRKSR